ncbi:hypothetical protein BZG80_11890 [Salinivibrio sp. MA440]|uniref:sulfotransferase family protein n=1 Tax=Salinivibrio sp. MA440 TaxID=1909456 RepID=UPI00098996CB|nr:sulfotransferase [Salinivibrio sp. MA440]OOF02674.1 hypothetical protein BZG80_11890 [Salinivibrio sp. MA440]
MQKRTNLFIVGGQKCGTSALAHFLSQHPSICMALGKEAHVFDQPMFCQLTQSHIEALYTERYPHYSGERYVCDATPIYAYWQDIPKHIAAYNPEAKLVMVVRNPVERAISQYAMSKNRGQESLNVFLAFLLEPLRMRVNQNRNWKQPARTQSYLSRGTFKSQIENLFRYFLADNILIIHHQDLLYQHDAVLNRVFEFLNISSWDIAAESIFSGQYSLSRSAISYRLAKRYAAYKLKEDIDYIEQFRLEKTT